MKNNILILFVVSILIIASCKKEGIYFDSMADKNLEVPLLLDLNEKACFLDLEGKTFKYSVDQDSISDFSPFVDFQDISEFKFNEIELTNHSINKLGEIKTNTPYSIEIKTDGITNSFTIYFTSLPLVQIITLDKVETEPKVFGRIILNYPENDKKSIQSLIGIEYRGASTQNFKKKSFGFKLINGFDMDNTTLLPFFDMRSNNKWILDGMVVDKSKLRNKTGFEIWETLPDNTEHISIKSEYVEVFHNSQYLGIYCFNENITGESLSLNDESVLIVGKDNTKATKFETFPSNKSENTFWDSWEQKYPDPESTLNWNSFKTFSKLVVESDDAEFSEEIFNQIERNNVIDYYLFINLFYGSDNIGKNWFFMQDSPNDKFVIIPWDLDASWGRSFCGDEVSCNKHLENGLFERLIEVNPQDFRLSVKTRWEQLRLNEFSDTNLFSKFNANFNTLNRARITEFENYIWDDDLDLIEEENYIETWISNRLIYLDGYFSSF